MCPPIWHPSKSSYARYPPLLLKGSTFPSKVEEVNSLAADRDVLLDDSGVICLKTQDQMRIYANNYRREVTFQAGVWVLPFLNLKPYKPCVNAHSLQLNICLSEIQFTSPDFPN